MEKEKAPNCYECKFRGEVPGSAHSCCEHSSFKAVKENSLLGLMAAMSGSGMPPARGDGKISVKGNPHGIRNGWFSHPYNFDPTWLEECSGFEPK